jgi:hypothetical protein
MTATSNNIDSFSKNIQDFIERYPGIKEREIEKHHILVRDAKDKLDKQKINAQNTQVPQKKILEENIHRELLFAYYKQQKELRQIEYHMDKYLLFIKNPHNESQRLFINNDLPNCNTFENFVWIVNLSQYTYMYYNYGLPCTCSADKESFRHSLYTHIHPENHIFILCKGFCSYGTRMMIDKPERHFSDYSFIDNYNSLDMDVIAA